VNTSTSELEAPAAYEAARDRALRTTEALILAEGQVRQLERRLAEVTADRDRLMGDAVKLRNMRARRRVRDQARRARERGVVEDAAEDSDPVGYTGAVGQAD
jgi:hypothetical protein